MQKLLLLILFSPLMAISQDKKNTDPSSKNIVSPANSYTINGEISSFKDSTAVILLNPEAGTPEAQAMIVNGKFTLKGSVSIPSYRVLQFDNQPVYFALFLDNSVVNITGTKDSIQRLKVTGSPSHAQFENFNYQLRPYEYIFSEQNPIYDSLAFVKATKICRDFIIKNPSSFVTPLALLRYHQITDAGNNQLETLFAGLSPAVKKSPYSAFIIQLIADAKKNPIGSTLADFSQPDTSGNLINLTSLKGKYVLVDFWASWCRPCRQENPNVVAAYHKFKDKNFTILGVSLDKAKQAWINAIKMDSLDWVHVSDLKGWENAVAMKYKIQSIPQNFLIDPQGKIIAKNVRGASLERVLTKMLR